MREKDLVRRSLLALALVLSVAPATAQNRSTTAIPVRYELSLASASAHILHVDMSLSGGAAVRQLRMPVWNALYQVRDFAQHILRISAAASDGSPLALKQVSTSSWMLTGAERGAVVRYDTYVDDPGPYGAQLSDSHAFLNLAQVLLYDTSLARSAQLLVEVRGPQQWTCSCGPRGEGDLVGNVEGGYDELVDTPIEAGTPREIRFKDGEQLYRIFIDADSADYDPSAIEQSVRRIVYTETEWMKAAPCPVYTFIYHFPRTAGGGGMEHACSTAIDVPAERLKSGEISALEGVTAHEFFHLWNVKRIRPQSLEPVDYSREQDTRALWFSEGVTSTVEDVMLLRAGLITADEYLRRVSFAIELLDQRPARKTQSVEESSLQAWFEKYPFYRRPERSISYYNKGEILGVMLDLAVRDATAGNKSLRDVFLWMNERYAMQGKYFADSEGVRAAVEAVSGIDFKKFFESYVAGTEDIPYDKYLGVAGYRVENGPVTIADPGFVISRNFNELPEVISVQPGSDAAKAGVKVGDIVLTVKKQQDVSSALIALEPGEVVQFRLRSGNRERELKFKVGSKEASHFSIVDVEHPTAEQLRQRSLWLVTNVPQQRSAATARQQ